MVKPASCGVCSFLLGPGAHRILIVPSKSLFPQSCVSSGGSLPLQQATANPYPCRRHSNTVLAQSLWGLWVLVHTRFVWDLWASLSMGFDSKCTFAPFTIVLGLLLCPWTWGISSNLFQHGWRIIPLYQNWSSNQAPLENGGSWPPW